MIRKKRAMTSYASITPTDVNMQTHGIIWAKRARNTKSWRMRILNCWRGVVLEADMDKLKPCARYALLAAATVLGWLVIAANGASWGLARLQAATQIRAELLKW